MRRFAAVAALIACALVTPAPPARAADDAAALIAKHAAYVGWHAADGVVKTLRATGEATRDGKPRATVTSLRYGVAFRNTSINADGLRSDSGFTGTVSWTSNVNGFTVRPVGEIVRYEFARDALFAETTTTAAFTPSVRRNEKVDGVDCTVVRLTSQVGFPIDVYVDPATGQYRRAVIDPDGKYEDVFNGMQYTAAGGKRFLSAWHHFDAKTRYSYTKIEPNAEIAPDDLRPPKQTATWTFDDAPAQIEYRDQPYPRIFIDVTVNGTKGKFIFDTGADGIVMLDSFARAAGAKRFSSMDIGGIGPNTAKANVFRVDTIGVGGSTLHDVIVSSGLDEEWKRAGIVGIIGFDLLAGTVAELSLDAKTLRLMDPAKVAPDERAGMVVHADLSDHHIRVPMRVNDRVDVIATLDTGNPADVLLSEDLIRREKLTFMTKYQAYASGIGGTEVQNCGKLKSLTLGPVRYNLPAACDSSSLYRNEILVGLDFMRAFNYVFDYPDGIIVMIPRKNY
ncbi:MAG: Retroviral aspartyl protease [Candidatus Eremiobacteraeota bacterium]|nr:Retroviral aspartyl protease [Candidatus Eremiobacteraeota bacterium]